MRRRQVWQALRRAEHATVTPIPPAMPVAPVAPVACDSTKETKESAEQIKVGEWTATRAEPEPSSKGPGTCPKCHQYIGRGMHFHIRACKG